jgi:cytochrome c oxidase cbb3-type subunit 3
MAVKRDEVTGTETTGHEWDGITELDTDPPRWMSWCLRIAFLWALAYWIAMPAWPSLSDFTPGILDYQQRQVVADQLAAATDAQSPWVTRMAGMSVDDIAGDAELRDLALKGGKAAFGDNCVVCHGTDAQGRRGFPNLADDSWLWGGSLAEIEQSIAVGINSNHDESRQSQMLAFGRDQILDRSQIQKVANYVLSLSGADHDWKAAIMGAEIFSENCAGCHGEFGLGIEDVGAPNLADGFWIYGGDLATVRKTIHGGRQGVMPSWSKRLDGVTIKQLAIFVHALGGGQPTEDGDESD